MQWLRDGLGIIRTAAEVEALAASVPDNGGVYLVPAFAGLGAPHWDPYARGTIVGLTRGTTRGAHRARGARERSRYQSRGRAATRWKPTPGITLNELRVDGGARANNLLMQFQADLLGVPVVRPEGHRDDRARRRLPRRARGRLLEERGRHRRPVAGRPALRAHDVARPGGDAERRLDEGGRAGKGWSSQ